MSAITRTDQQPPTVQMDPAALMQAIVERGITPESVSVMKDLLEMQRTMRAESAKASFAEAFAQVRRECGKIRANKTIPTSNGGIKGQFADLREIQDQIEPLLERHGFFLSFDQTRLEGGLTRVECIVGHKDGHEMRCGFTCREHTSPQNTPAQNDAGTNTLAKRTALCNMFGIRIDSDSDARLLGDTISPEQALELQRRAESVLNNDVDRLNTLLRFAGATAWENVRHSGYERAMRELDRQSGVTTQKPQTKTTDPAKELSRKIREWSGVKAEDLPAAIASVKKKLGINGPATPEQITMALAWVNENSTSDFTEVVA